MPGEQITNEEAFAIVHTLRNFALSTSGRCEAINPALAKALGKIAGVAERALMDVTAHDEGLRLVLRLLDRGGGARNG